jgi:MoxR-like ATPase
VVDTRLHEYAVNLVAATRNPSLFDLGHLKRFVTYGASPRASINMITAARALALLRGRQYALAEDVWTLAPDILRHRLVLSYEALAEDVAVTDIIEQIIERVPTPQLGYAGELSGPGQRSERILAANTLGASAPVKRRWWQFGRRG